MDKEKFAVFLKSRGIKENSIYQYVSAMSKFSESGDLHNNIIKFVFENKRTVSVKRSAIKHYLDFTGRKTLYDEFVSEFKGKFTAPARKQLKKSITFSQVKSVVESLDKPYNLVCMLQYDTDCRISAILKLLKRNIEPTSEGVKITVKEKRDKIRTLWLSEDTGKMLLAFTQESDEKIFGSLKYWDVWDKIRKKAEYILGFPISSHWFRGSRIIHLLEKGYDVRTIMKLSGHGSLRSIEPYLLEAGLDTKKLSRENPISW